jgi:hypothetical protein
MRSSPAGLDFQPFTGGGGFNVSYDPLAQRLDITLRVGFEFYNGLRIDGAGTVQGVAPDCDDTPRT